MIHRVNKLVMFKNSFTRTGRLANREIKKLLSMSDSGDIYQKNLPNGKIALQQDQKLKSLRKSMTLILNKYGIQNEITREKRSIKSFDISSIRKKDLTTYSTKEKQVLSNTKNGKIEEKATRHAGLGSGVTLHVISRANRESEFPATDIAGSIHPTIYKKITYPNGDTSYVEMYPCL